MHQGRPHQGFDPTMALPKEGWMSYQGIPHEYPTEGAPLELTLAYGGEEEPQFGPLKEGYAFPEQAPGLLGNGGENPDTIVPQSLRRLTEPENAAEMAGLIGTGFIEPFGSTIDVIDFLAGVEDGDWARSSWAAAGLLLPFVAGSTMRKVGGEAVEAIKKRKVWHGTDQDILDTPRLSPHDDTALDAFSVSTDFDEARKYADNTMIRTGPGTARNSATGRVYEYELPEDKIVDYSDFWDLIEDEFGSYDKIPEGFDIAEEARRRGYVAFDMAQGMGRGEIAVIDPAALSNKLEFRNGTLAKSKSPPELR